MMQSWYYVESLTGQRHDRVQTENQIATVDSCFDLVGSRHQHGLASNEVISWSTDRPLMADNDDLRWNIKPKFL